MLSSFGRLNAEYFSSCEHAGTFQAVEHVILVGVGGGVPHYTDSSRHVRLGDVVVASPVPSGNKCVFVSHYPFQTRLSLKRKGMSAQFI